MDNEANTEVVTDTNDNNTAEVTETQETISLSKAEYEKLNQTLGSLKRELKDYKKAKEEPKETSTKPDDNKLLERVEKMTLRSANISHPDDIELAKSTAKKWNMDLEDVLVDEDFQVKLVKQQTARDNLAATSNIKGGAGSSQAKFSPEYWIAKGTPPSASDVPDRKARAKIARAMLSNAKSSKTFYSD